MSPAQIEGALCSLSQEVQTLGARVSSNLVGLTAVVSLLVEKGVVLEGEIGKAQEDIRGKFQELEAQMLQELAKGDIKVKEVLDNIVIC